METLFVPSLKNIKFLFNSSKKNMIPFRLQHAKSKKIREIISKLQAVICPNSYKQFAKLSLIGEYANNMRR
jgi:hypothetical protein